MPSRAMLVDGVLGSVGAEDYRFRAGDMFGGAKVLFVKFHQTTQ